MADIIDALFGGPSWLERANQQRQQSLANYLQGGVPAMMGNTQGTQELAGGFAGSTSRAKAGGEVAKSNQAFYKGGQFLPSTDAPPGTYKFGNKVLTTGRQQIEPGKYEVQPSPLHTSIYQSIYGYARKNPEGKLEMMPNIRGPNMEPLSPDMDWRPGVKGIRSTEPITYQELLDKYNNGERWVEVKLPENP